MNIVETSMRIPLKRGHLYLGHHAWFQLHRRVYKASPEMRTPHLLTALLSCTNSIRNGGVPLYRCAQDLAIFVDDDDNMHAIAPGPITLPLGMHME